MIKSTYNTIPSQSLTSSNFSLFLAISLTLHPQTSQYVPLCFKPGFQSLVLSTVFCNLCPFFLLGSLRFLNCPVRFHINPKRYFTRFLMKNCPKFKFYYAIFLCKNHILCPFNANVDLFFLCLQGCQEPSRCVLVACLKGFIG